MCTDYWKNGTRALAPNQEIDLLVKLVGVDKNIIENKKSDAVTWKEKERCWKAIEASFNSTSGVAFRNAKTLKLKYEGIKRMARKKSALIRAETYRTGGGPSTAPDLTDTEEKVKKMILLSVDGMESTYDSDNVAGTPEISLQPESISPTHHSEDSQVIDCCIVDYENPDDVIELSRSSQNEDAMVVVAEGDLNKTQVQPLKRHISCENQLTPKMKKTSLNDTNLDDDNMSGTDKKWSDWKPKALRSKKHPALCTSKAKRPFEKLAESKLDVADLQKLILEEELENKRKHWIFEEKEREQKQKRWDFEEEERDHKRQMWALEKKHFLENNDKK